ncbi:unnamed protein product [Alopecurus aequalis]
MPPSRLSRSSYHGVRVRPSAVFYVEIRAAGHRIVLDTFGTAHEAAHAYDAAARAPALRHELPRRQLRGASDDARATAVHRNAGGSLAPPLRREERAEKCVKKAFINAQFAGPCTIDDDERWLDESLATEESSSYNADNDSAVED